MLTVAGVGPGNPKYLTVDVKERIQKAEKVIAFGRVGHSISSIRDDYIEVNRVDSIIEILDKDRDTLLLASGDPNFFGIVEYLNRNDIQVDSILPGLSSFQYLMCKLQMSWQGAKFLSLHGRDHDLKDLLNHRLVIMLIDKRNTPNHISREFGKLGMLGTMYVGFNLSYDDEKIIKARIGEKIEDYSSLGVVVVENEMD
ncbi:MAG TPA: precorrin-6y C5,15-methyltransferase (decarboxylating) subunit CbiE [Clostridia bacterium]|nr:precorrin-6y C5,15-methyltransferase (decarboxylating) subunit CbiE [Clostridia bacterium]